MEAKTPVFDFVIGVVSRQWAAAPDCVLGYFSVRQGCYGHSVRGLLSEIEPVRAWNEVGLSGCLPTMGMEAYGTPEDSLEAPTGLLDTAFPPLNCIYH